MTFRDLFEALHRRDPAIRGAALAGADGLAVDEWQAPPADRDLPALCAEMAHLFKETGRVVTESGLGETREVCVAGEGGLILVRRVTDDYFMLLVADPAAVPGRCRFLLSQGAARARNLL